MHNEWGDHRVINRFLWGAQSFESIGDNDDDKDNDNDNGDTREHERTTNYVQTRRRKWNKGEKEGWRK